ncbi:MAG: TIGR03089 family protein, partial [Candidatus Nanopelagicales bacterium]
EGHDDEEKRPPGDPGDLLGRGDGQHTPSLRATVPPMTPYAALVHRVRANPAQPLLTYVVPARGERMELSAASFMNAVAKAAGLLRDDLDVEPGDHVGMRLPCHWQRSVWWAACTFVGAVCVPDATESVTVTSRDHLDECTGANEIVLVSLAPFGLPDGERVPPGVTEAAVAVRAHPDEFVPYSLPQDDWLITTDQTAAELMSMAADFAGARGAKSDSRFAVLCNDVEAASFALPMALVTGGSVVIIDDRAEVGGAVDITATLQTEGAPLIRGGP